MPLNNQIGLNSPRFGHEHVPDVWKVFMSADSESWRQIPRDRFREIAKKKVQNSGTLPKIWAKMAS